jgi:hypothetical protein
MVVVSPPPTATPAFRNRLSRHTVEAAVAEAAELNRKKCNSRGIIITKEEDDEEEEEEIDGVENVNNHKNVLSSLFPPVPPKPSSFILVNPKLIVLPRNRRDDGGDGIPFTQRLDNTTNNYDIMWNLLDEQDREAVSSKEQQDEKDDESTKDDGEDGEEEEMSSSSSTSLSDVRVHDEKEDVFKADDSAFVVAEEEEECLKQEEVDADNDYVDEMVQTMYNVSAAELSTEAKDHDVVNEEANGEDQLLHVVPTEVDEKAEAIDPPGRRLSTAKAFAKSRSKESLAETNTDTQEDLLDKLILKTLTTAPLPGQDSCSTTTATSSKSEGDSVPSSSNSTILIDAVDGDDNCCTLQNSFKEETSTLPDDSKMRKVIVLRRSKGKPFGVLENVKVTVEDEFRRDSDNVKGDDTKAAIMAAADDLLLQKQLIGCYEKDSGTECTEEDDDSIFDSLDAESCSSTSQQTLLPFDIIPTSAGYEIKMFPEAADEQCSYTLQCLDVISTSAGYEINLATTGVEAAFLQHITKAKLMRRAQKNKDFEIIQMEGKKGGTNEVSERFDGEALVDAMLENVLLGRMKEVGNGQAPSQQPCQFVIVMESSPANKAFVEEENDSSTLVDDEEYDDQSDLTSQSGSTEDSEYTNDCSLASSTLTGYECDEEKMSSGCPVLSIKAEAKELDAIKVEDVLDTMQVEEAYPEQPELKPEFRVFDMKSSLSVVQEGEVESCVTEENYPTEAEVELVGDEKHVDAFVAEAEIIADEGLEKHELAPGPEVEVVGIAVHSNGMVEI